MLRYSVVWNIKSEYVKVRNLCLLNALRASPTRIEGENVRAQRLKSMQGYKTAVLTGSVHKCRTCPLSLFCLL